MKNALYASHLGVNAIASWSATTGLAEAARRSVEALIAAGVDVCLEDVDYGAPRDDRRLPDHLRALPRGRLYPIDLCFLNVNEMSALSRDYLRRPNRPSYLIGSWFWELPTLPRGIQANVARVDEIWVASRFVREAMMGYTSAPIFTVPAVVEPRADENLTRHDLGLPEDSCLFLFNFDAHSTFARKNPLAVIDAFREAFTRAERGVTAHLVLKAINLWSSPEGRAALLDELERVDGVLIEDHLHPAEMAALISLSDVYVSLHRAEGFGLGMAEAMYFRKPVIGTSYSGNMDFMTAENSCPVGYQLRELDATDLMFNARFVSVYEPGQLWAEPDRRQAASWMRFLYENPTARERIGSRGAATIRRRSTRCSVGAAMRTRLESIQADQAS